MAPSVMISPSLWPFRRPRIGLAFSPRRLVAVRDNEAAEVVSRELPEGMLVPSPVTPNMQSTRDVARWVTELLDELGPRRVPVVFLLPDLSVVTSLFPAADRAGRRQLQGELDRRLPFPGDEARRDFWWGDAGEALGAAVRDAVVRQYERIIEASERKLDWVDATSLVRIPEWARASSVGEASSAHVQLYTSHYCVTVFRAGELVELRFKLRAPEDTDAVARELLRLPMTHESLASMSLHGEGASSCAALLEGVSELGSVQVGEADSEEAQLLRALISLIRRS